MRILRTMIVPILGLIGLTPLIGGCEHDEHHDRDERRAYPAGYRYDHDRDWDHDRGDRDDWRRDRY